jgi:hypothetical protein
MMETPANCKVIPTNDDGIMIRRRVPSLFLISRAINSASG